MKLLTGLFLLSLAPLSQVVHGQSAPSIAGTWHGFAIAHHVQVPLTLRISGSGGNLKAALLNGPDEAPASSAVLTGDHLEISFSDYAKNFDLTRTGSGTDAKLTGSFGNKTIRYAITLLAPGTEVSVSHPAPAGVDGDWEIAVPNIRGEKAWKLKVEHLSPSLSRAVIQRIDGDTGSIYATDPSSGIYTHFSAYGPMIYHFTPEPDGSLIVSNMMSADLNPPELQNLVAHRPDDARKLALPPPTDIAQQTTVKDPSVPFAFSFPDLSGKLVSNTDARFDGKVIVIAIGGSWCPNCHDEAPLLESLYKKFHDRGLEVVSLSFEEEEQMRNPTGLRAFVARYGLTFPVLLAGNTDQLNEKIPQGVNLNCWPTSFFLGRDGRVKEVHAGFSGPASPAAHDALVREVTELVEHLLAEAGTGPLCDELKLEEVFRQKHHIRWPLRQSAHEVGIPLRAEWDVHAHAKSLRRQLALQIAPHSIQHLKFELALFNALLFHKLQKRIHDLLIVRRNPAEDVGLYHPLH